MRNASPGCIAYINANPVVARADLLTLTLADGTVYRWTNHNADLTAATYGRNTQTYRCRPNAPIVDIGQEDEGEEPLAVAALAITLSGQDFKIGGKSLMVAAADGVLDAAFVRLDHLIMPTPGDVSLQAFVDFDGQVDQPDIGVSEVTLRSKSWLNSAALTQLPKRVFAPNCQWDHYGPGCGLNRDDWQRSGTVSSATDASTLGTNLTSGSGALNFSWGDLVFDGNMTSALAGVRADVASHEYDTGVLHLSQPLPTNPAAGDTFTIWPGCPKSTGMILGAAISWDQAWCKYVYNNFARYGGFPFVPPNTSVK